MARRIKALPPNWQEYLSCMLFITILPLLPLIIEMCVRGHVANESMFIGAALYAVTIGLSCQNQLLLGLAMFAMTMLSVFHGIALTHEQAPSVSFPLAQLVIVAFAVAHTCIKFNYHVVDNQPFWFKR